MNSDKSKVPLALRNTLAAVVLAAGLGGGVLVHQQNAEEGLRNEYVQAVAADPSISAAVKVAMVMGAFYESSNKHIGTPYVDTRGKGQPLTVCNGVTGPEVVAGKTYTPADCYRLERRRYVAAEREAIAALPRWYAYDTFVQATFIDFIWNKGAANFATSTMRRKALAGDIVGACRENPRWNRGTINGVSTVLPGLQIRGESNDEICRLWRMS